MFAEKIIKIFKKTGRDWFILIIALFLASFMWIVQSFSKGYSKYFSYKVAVKTYMPGRSQISVSNNVLVVRGKSSGYYIMRKNYTKKFDQIDIAVDPKLIRSLETSSNPDGFYILNNDIMDQIQGALGKDLQLEWFASDTLFFVFPLQYNKKVPVIARPVLKYRPQYMATGELLIDPDSITIFGERNIINGINSVYTRVFEENDIDDSFEGIIALVPINDVEFSQKDVSYRSKTVRYVENTINVPTTITGAPQDMNVIMIPKETVIKYRINIGNKKKFSKNDFMITADYKDIIKSQNNKVMLTLSRYPEDIIAYTIEPKFAEFIIAKSKENGYDPDVVQ